MFFLWDVMFGTAHISRQSPKAFGISHYEGDPWFVQVLLGLLTTVAATWSAQRDSSRRGVAEQALRDSDERYRRLLEAAPDAMVRSSVSSRWSIVTFRLLPV